MSVAQTSRSARIRASLDHPVIDVDGHVIEFLPALVDTLKEVAGPDMVKRTKPSSKRKATKLRRAAPGISSPPRNDLTSIRFDRRGGRIPPKTHSTGPPRCFRGCSGSGSTTWVSTSPCSIRASRSSFFEPRTTSCAKPSVGPSTTYHAELYREHSERMTPAATIPMHTPQEAVEEIEHVVNELGMKVIMIAGSVRRPIPACARLGPEAARYGYWIDSLGLDSAYDYDPVWEKCLELKVTPTSHSPGQGTPWGSRHLNQQFHVQPYRSLCRGGRGVLQSAVHGRGDAALSQPQIRFPGMWCGMGRQPLRGHGGPLAEAQRPRH